MNLIIDLGNTFAKIAVFENKKLIKLIKYNSLSKEDLLDVLIKYPKIKKVVLSSVIKHDKNIETLISKNFNKFITLGNRTKLPFKILYKTINTLGKDRLAGVAGANNIFPDRNVLIFDLGTAVTIDFLNKNNEFLGGNISPGMAIRFKSLNDYTEKLPLCEKSDLIDLTADNTNSAVVFGVVNSIIFEIEEYIRRYRTRYDELEIIMTGGDSLYFEKNLKNPIFVEPNLVLLGLNSILNYNV